MNQKKSVSKYYKESQAWWNIFWGTEGIHFGLQGEEKTPHKEAVRNTNKLVGHLLSPKEGDKILDAGMGIGATARYIAKTYKAHVTGITIAENQVQEAKKQTPTELDELLDYLCRDFENTGFDKDSFDGVYGIESICHGDTDKFLIEAHRILKDKGKLVVVDYSIDDNLSPEHQKKYEIYLRGQHIQAVLPVNQFKDRLKKAGFSDIKHMDHSDRAIPSFKRIRNLVYGFGWLLYPLSKTGIIPKDMGPHIKSAMAMYSLFQDGKFRINSYSAIK